MFILVVIITCSEILVWAVTPIKSISGAGERSRVGLQKLSNDQNEENGETKLLAYQLQQLKNHLGGSFQNAYLSRR